MSLLSIPDITLPSAHRQPSRSDAASGASAFADAVRREAVRRDDAHPSPRRERAGRDDAAPEKSVAEGGTATASAGPVLAGVPGAGDPVAVTDASDGSSPAGRIDATTTDPQATARSTHLPAPADTGLAGTTVDAMSPVADAVIPATDGIPAAAVAAAATAGDSAPRIPTEPDAASTAADVDASTDPATTTGAVVAKTVPASASAGDLADADAGALPATGQDTQTPAGATAAPSASGSPGTIVQAPGVEPVGVPIAGKSSTDTPAPTAGAASVSAATAPAPDGITPAVPTAPGTATAASESIRTSAEPRVAEAAPTAPVVAPPADARAVAASAAPAPAAPVPRQVLLPQLSAPVLSLARAADGEHSVTLTVAPDSLGPVTVRAHIAAGVIRLELHAPSEAGRDALRAILTDLRRDLAAAAPGASLAMSSDSSAAGSTADGRQGASGRSDPGAGPDARSGGDARDDRGGLPGHRSSPASSVIRTLPPHGGLDLYA